MRFAVFITLLAAVTASASAETRPTDVVPDALRDQMAIPHDYTVICEDQDGHVVPFSQFQALMKGRPFDIQKSPEHHSAVLRLESDAVIAAHKQARAQPAGMSIQGKPFPAFHATTLDGKAVSLASLRGKPFIANFFFALCAPCIAETPVLSQFHRAHPDVPVVAFTFDDAATAQEFATRRGFNWPIVPGQDALAKQVGVDVYPTMVLVDAHGVVSKATHSSAIAAKSGALTLGDLERWGSSGPR